MQSTFKIMTEYACDLPSDYMQQNDVLGMPINFSINEKQYDDSFEHQINLHEFYQKLRSGSNSSTAQITPNSAKTIFEKQLSKGYDILYIGFSSGLSGGFQSVCMAKSELQEMYPNRKIITIDSLCASLGQGLLVDYAVKQRDKFGDTKTIEEIAKMVEDIKMNVCHYFTVADLHFLHRGGRVSKATAIVGSLLDIKPVMHVDNDGKLVPYGKVRGRKQSLIKLVARMGEKLSSYQNEYVFISHGDCIEDANFVANLVFEKYQIKAKIINAIGAVIGSHSGPDTIALFFIGTNRDEKPL
ncbi:MAG: DegV family protein [Oscillospiraceae bacterium]